MRRGRRTRLCRPPLALLLADAGFRVTGFEVDAQKVEKLSRGESYIYRVPSTEVHVREAQLVVDTRNATPYPFIEDRAVLITSIRCAGACAREAYNGPTASVSEPEIWELL